MKRTVLSTAAVCLASVLGVTACSGSDDTEPLDTPSVSERADSAAEETDEPSSEDEETQVAAEDECAAATDELDVVYGDPVAYSDIFAEGNDRTWRHGVPVTVTNGSDATCLFVISGQLTVDGEEAGRMVREIAMRPGQVATLEDLPMLEEHVPFDQDGEAGVPTVEWSAGASRITAMDLAPDYYDYEVVSIEPKQLLNSGIRTPYKTYHLDVEVAITASNPDGAYEDVPASGLGGMVWTVLHVNGLDADGNIVATWQLSGGEKDTFTFEIPSVGGGEVGAGLTGRGDVFFNSLAAVESVVDYDVVTMQPFDILE